MPCPSCTRQGGAVPTQLRGDPPKATRSSRGGAVGIQMLVPNLTSLPQPRDSPWPRLPQAQAPGAAAAQCPGPTAIGGHFLQYEHCLVQGSHWPCQQPQEGKHIRLGVKIHVQRLALLEDSGKANELS